MKAKNWQERLHETIYESNTTGGKIFDVALLLFIIASILVVMLDSMESWHRKFGSLFYTLE